MNLPTETIADIGAAADKLGKLRGLADRLDDASERCAARATQRDKEGRSELATDLLARASTYQECAGLIREALK